MTEVVSNIQFGTAEANTDESLGLKDYTTQTLRINGFDMSVLIAGEGPDVLLVHGYPDTRQVWRKQISALVEAGYRVIAPDTRGCGQSEITHNISDYQVFNLVADLIGLLDKLEIEKVRLVGHDWGSAMSWYLVTHHPERVDRYVALSTGHVSSYTSGGLAQKIKGYYTMMFQIPFFMEWFLRSFNWFGFRLMTGYPEEQAQWQSELSRPGRLTAGLNYYRANTKLFITGKIPNAKVPVMGVWSSGDRFLAKGQMQKTGDYVDAPFKYVEIEGANHWIPLSGAEKLNPVLLDYLK